MDYLMVLVIIGMVGSVLSADKTMTDGDVSVQVLGRSGKMKIWRQVSSGISDQNSTDSKAKPITIFLDSLKEVDKDGNEVGKSGTPKHSFNTFASQDFTISTIKSGKLPNSNISTSYFDFECTLNGLTSKVKLTVYIVKEDGEFTLGNTTVEVKKGMVKFSVELSSWTWCAGSSCKQGNTDEIGAFVDLELTVQLHGSQKVKEDTDDDDKGAKKFEFGEEQSMETPKTISIDNVYKMFPAGYPKFEMKNSKNTFTFRFEKFNSKALYDPTIEAGASENNSATSALASLLTIMAALIASMYSA